MDCTTTNYSILLQNIVVYHEKIIYTTKCNILQQCVIFTTERGNSHYLPYHELLHFTTKYSSLS